MTTAASLTQWRFGRHSPKASPSCAVSHTKAASTASTSSPCPAGMHSTAMAHPAQNHAPGSVSSNCSSTFTRRTCCGATGRLCSSQRVPPSSDTDGAVIKFMAAMAHTIPHTSIGRLSGG